MPRPKTHFSLHPPAVLCGAATTRHRALKTSDDLANVTCKRCIRAANTLHFRKTPMDEPSEPCHLIAYQWRRPGGSVNMSNCVWRGSPAAWLLDKIGRPEHYCILWATPITRAEYDALNGHID